MTRPLVFSVLLGGSLAAAVGVSDRAPVEPPQGRAADSLRYSSDWLGLLPDGEEKRRFILDCTGCHQLDDQVVQPGGKARTGAEFSDAITRMLGFSGSTTGF